MNVDVARDWGVHDAAGEDVGEAAVIARTPAGSKGVSAEPAGTADVPRGPARAHLLR